MLAGISPQMFDEWVAWRHVEPDPLEKICGILKIGFATLAALNHCQLSPDFFDPTVKAEKPEESQSMGPQQTAKAIRLAYGMGS